MKKKYLIAGIALILVLAIGVVVYKAIGSLDKVILFAVNEYGPEITQAEVRLEDVQLDLAEGTAMLKGLLIGNPKGFNTEYAMKLDQVKVALDLDSLTSDTILIKEVLIDAPAIIYEMASGGSNIDTLSNNINAYTGGEQKENKDSGTKLVISDLYVNNAEISVSHSALKGKKMSVNMPDIHLEDIGKEEGGATPGEVAQEVMGSMKAGIGSAVSALNLDKLGGAMKEGLGNAGEKLKGLGEDAGEKLKGLFK